MKIIFFVEGIPVAKGRPRFTKTGIAYTPTKTRDAEDAFRLQSNVHAPKKPIEGAVRLELSFNMPIPKSRRKEIEKKAGSCEWVPHIVRPDIDNMAKLVTDSMNKRFWKDDSQVSVIIANKQYGEKVGTYVVVESLGDENEER